MIANPLAPGQWLACSAAIVGLLHADFFFHSPFLIAVGFAMLVGYVLLAKEYWFWIPLTGLSIALVLYCWAVLQAWLA